MDDADRISLRHYVDALFAAHDRDLDQRFEDIRGSMSAMERATATSLRAIEQTTQRADAASDRRFEGVNEFRRQLADQTASFLTRTEYQVEHRALVQRVALLEGDFRGQGGERRGVAQFVATVIAIVTAAGALIAALTVIFGWHH